MQKLNIKMEKYKLKFKKKKTFTTEYTEELLHYERKKHREHGEKKQVKTLCSLWLKKLGLGEVSSVCFFSFCFLIFDI